MNYTTVYTIIVVLTKKVTTSTVIRIPKYMREEQQRVRVSSSEEIESNANKKTYVPVLFFGIIASLIFLLAAKRRDQASKLQLKTVQRRSFSVSS